MLKLNYQGIQDRAGWAAAGVILPAFDWKKMADMTRRYPGWIHFGAGNIFRGFIARLQQSLLAQDFVESGIITVETFDYDIIDKIYAPFDNMTLMVSLKPDGTMEKEVVASIADGLRAGRDYEEEMEVLRAAFCRDSLQIVSFTITEKGYALNHLNGEWLPLAAADLQNGPAQCGHVMGIVTALLLERYRAGGAPLAMVSMDNCSRNGETLRRSVCAIADGWLERGFADVGFIAWLQDESKVSFPWSMIDKITPRPDKAVEAALTNAGIADMATVVTNKNTFIAPFVNAEVPQYLVVEDRFPNGRPPLERAGVYLTDRETVNQTERMKVTTCLNPLHTALAVFGCLLGYDSIAAEMKDPVLKVLVEKIGYDEGMPVVVNPGILHPVDFLREVLEERLPNPFIPDTPQRIATDTSQKMSIRFGETIKSYLARADLDVGKLIGIPLTIAGWLRYLLAVDDEGRPMECSADPMLGTLQTQLEQVRLGSPKSCGNSLWAILSNEVLFAVDLYDAGLAEKVEDMFRQMIGGPGAVRATLKRYL